MQPSAAHMSVRSLMDDKARLRRLGSAFLAPWLAANRSDGGATEGSSRPCSLSLRRRLTQFPAPRVPFRHPHCTVFRV